MSAEITKSLTLRDALHFQLLDQDSLMNYYGISKSTVYRLKKKSNDLLKNQYGITKSELNKKIV